MYVMLEPQTGKGDIVSRHKGSQIKAPETPQHDRIIVRLVGFQGLG